MSDFRFHLFKERDPFLSSTPHFIFFPLLHSCVVSEQRPEKEVSFHSRSLFQLKLFAFPEKQYDLNNPTSKQWGWVVVERESHAEKSDRPTRRDERGAGRAILTSLAPSDPVSGFLLSGNGECGWKGSGALPPPFRHFGSQTRSLCRHTPSHIPLNCARQQVNTHSSPGRGWSPLHLVSSATAAEKLWWIQGTIIKLPKEAEMLEWKIEKKGKPQDVLNLKRLWCLCKKSYSSFQNPEQPLCEASEHTNHCWKFKYKHVEGRPLAAHAGFWCRTVKMWASTSRFFLWGRTTAEKMCSKKNWKICKYSKSTVALVSISWLLTAVPLVDEIWYLLLGIALF